MITLYHNPRCSKSRQCDAFLKDTGKEVKVINYMKEPFTEFSLTELLKKLAIKPIELVRKNEKEWKELYKGKKLTDEEIIKAMVAHPKLIQRPIVVNDNKAVVCRPLEEVNKVL